jgi:hypothetical protein
MAAAIQNVKSKKSRTERIPINVSRPARFQVLSSTYAIQVCNYHAAMTVLNVGRLAGSGVGIAPKHPTGLCVGQTRNTTLKPEVSNKKPGRILVSGYRRPGSVTRMSAAD